nr:hypothetical protein [Actinomycetota bacterium]
GKGTRGSRQDELRACVQSSKCRSQATDDVLGTDGQPRRCRPKLTELVPVRFPAETLDEIRRRAGEDDPFVSSWIRRAVEHELKAEKTG